MERSKTKKIYIIQMHTKTIPSRIIKLFTKYDYSHIGISFDKSCNTIYSFGRKKYNSILDAGFVVEHKNGKFFEKFKDTKCRIYELSITKEQYFKIKKRIVYMKNHQQLFKYDYVGIFLRYFKIPVSFKHKYVCSYFIADILEDADIYKFDKKIYFIEPKDFENIENINEIYSGKYLLYEKESGL